MSLFESPSSRPRGRPQRGMLSVEALASLGLMAVILAFVGQWSSAMFGHRQRVARRQEAIHAMDNVVALAMATNFSQVSKAHLLAAAKPHTPVGGQWDIRVEPTPVPDHAGVLQKSIVVALTYPRRSEDNVKPLVVWRYAPQGEAE